MDQAHLAAIVVDYVQRFVNQFNATDLVWVRSMKASKVGVLNCQCRTVQIASSVRSTFASLIKSATPPTYLGKISISFAHEIGTRVRLSLLRSISRRQKDRDPEAICSISAFSARPLLRVGAKDSGTRFLSYVDAIHGFRHLLKQEDLDKALSLCTGLKGHLKSKFIVLSDDRVLPPAPQGGQGRGKRPHPDSRSDRVHQKRPNTAASVNALPPSANWANQASTVSGANNFATAQAGPPPPPSTWVNPLGVVSAPIISHALAPVPGVMQLQPSSSQQAPSVASPGVGFPPLNIPKVSDSQGFIPAKSRGRKKKVNSAKNLTPSRTVPNRSVKSQKVKDVASEEDQDASVGSSEESGNEYVDAPNEEI